jgi:ferredoxin-NADP reductase
VRPVGTVSDRYHPLRVARVVGETADAISIVFDVPADLSESFAYVAGQFVTLRLDLHGERIFRSYSMSSTPGVDAQLQVTVKRVTDGVVSNWLNDSVREGDVLDVSVPTGVFVLDDRHEDVVAFAAGSGITPVYSILKSALHTTTRSVRLLFANRDRGTAIFGDAIDVLATCSPGRLTIEHHEDVAGGFLTAADIQRFVGASPVTAAYVCGPEPFMELVETTLRGLGTSDDNIHIERFTPLAAPADVDDEALEATAEAVEVVISIGNETKTVAQRGRSTILQSARWAGLPAPSSCEAGHCATCMARVVEGTVRMTHDDVLTPDELREGWVLTCQAVPTSPMVRVVYD